MYSRQVVRESRLCKKDASNQSINSSSRIDLFSITPWTGIDLLPPTPPILIIAIIIIIIIHFVRPSFPPIYSCINATISSSSLLFPLACRPRHHVYERVLTIPHLMEARRRSNNPHDPLSKKIRRGSSQEKSESIRAARDIPRREEQ